MNRQKCYFCVKYYYGTIFQKLFCMMGIFLKTGELPDDPSNDQKIGETSTHREKPKTAQQLSWKRWPIKLFCLFSWVTSTGADQKAIRMLWGFLSLDVGVGGSPQQMGEASDAQCLRHLFQPGHSLNQTFFTDGKGGCGQNFAQLHRHGPLPELDRELFFLSFGGLWPNKKSGAAAAAIPAVAVFPE